MTPTRWEVVTVQVNRACLKKYEKSEDIGVLIGRQSFRELAIQIHNEARKFAQGSMVKSVVAYGGTSVFYQASQLQRGCNILVATPGRY